jgi:hypothetical protein
VPV